MSEINNSFGPTKCGLILEEKITKYLKPLDCRKIRRCFDNWMHHRDKLKEIKDKKWRRFCYQCLVVGFLKQTVFKDLKIERYLNKNDFDQHTVDIRKRLFYCIKRELLEVTK